MKNYYPLILIALGLCLFFSKTDAGRSYAGAKLSQFGFIPAGAVKSIEDEMFERQYATDVSPDDFDSQVKELFLKDTSLNGEWIALAASEDFAEHGIGAANQRILWSDGDVYYIESYGAGANEPSVTTTLLAWDALLHYEKLPFKYLELKVMTGLTVQ